MSKHEDRLLFLKEFTRHLILNSKKPFESYQELINEFPQPIQSNFIPQPSFIPQQVQPVEIRARNIMPIPRPNFGMGFSPSINNQQPRQGFTPASAPLTAPSPQTISPDVSIARTRDLQQPRGPRFDIQPQMANQPPQEYMQVQPMPLPLGFELGKLNFMIYDPRVTTVECPGPGKLLLVRTYGKNSVTKISLNKEEISNLLNKFSREAKIPVISGLFKAAVGNLIVTAVVSELVGTRFVINKISPGFAIEQINRNF